MSDVNFILYEMTFFKYFIPLIIEGNKRGVLSKVFIGENQKYTSPQKHLKLIDRMSKEFGFQIVNSLSCSTKGVSFLVEGVGINNLQGDSKKIVLTYLRDFSVIYPKYINEATNVIFPSRFFAEHYGSVSDKNLYLGSPKYDVKFRNEEIKTKYGVKSHKIALIIFPLFEFLDREQQRRVLVLYGYLKKMGYYIVVKSRGKNPVCKMWHGDQYFEDYSWFPHTTMELISVSDIVINFDSTAVKECVMMSTPLINFRNKPTSMFGFLYNEEYSALLNFGVGFDKFRDVVENLVASDLSQGFIKAREKYLFQPHNVSKEILDKVL